ncbi:MAG: alanyl-tRNA synthetase [Patescibacteria group bacterium]|nr:alanyl-tRNA synthetase [Patescibacteria group bacterium]
MNAQQIRNEYLKFFKEREHSIISRAKLVPQDDPTTLFTGSGMQPLLPFLLGAKHSEGNRLVNSQTCLRSQDIEDVGDNRHTTFFEMLGNWSMGDYFKEQQIRWFFEFLTDIVGLDPAKIYVTAFIGDKFHNIPRDDEAAEIWQKVFAEKGIEAKIVEIGSQKDGDKRGIKPGERIFFYDDGENWWSRGGGLDKTPIGDPCGPDSEVFYDFGPQNHADGFGLAHPASDSGQFMEIGNQVFMQYRRLEDGSFEPLAKKNVDFGGGLERIAAASIDSPDVFNISILWPIIDKLQAISDKKYESHTESMRVIADHLRAATFLAVDGVTPSNKEQGYVMRRLLRRAIRFAFDLGIEQNFLEQIIPVIADIYAEDYPEVKARRMEVVSILVKEEKIFRQTLRKGLRELEKMKTNGLTGLELFTLYDTYGFPVELSTEEAFKQNIELSDNWRQEFNEKMNEQKQRSKTASQGVFKGGLDGQTETTTRYHTAAHLLGQAMRIVLGELTAQRGCNINEERLRFDFSYPEKVDANKLKQIEDIVNEQISKDLIVTFSEYPIAEARRIGAYGEFGDKYGEIVKVYRMQAENEDKPFSLEICGGPHVNRASELSEGGKRFKIIKEESSSAGVRRIKAILV